MPDTVVGAIELSILNMLMIFLVLILLGTIIVVVRNVIGGIEKKSVGAEPRGKEEAHAENNGDSEEGRVAQPVRIRTVPVSTMQEEDSLSNGHLTAVITAAVAMYLGEDSVPFAIKSIAPTDDRKADAWTLAGRQRLMRLRKAPAKRR